MTTPTTPSGPPAGQGVPSAPTSVVGQPGHAPYGYGGYPPAGQGGYGPPAFGGGPGYGMPPTGAMPGYGPPPPAPRRGWIGWLVGGVALVLVAGVVGAFLLFSGGGTLIAVSTTSAAIPDADPNGLAAPLVLDGSGKVQSMHVEASITHPYTCDLTVVLVSPQGTPVTLADPPTCSRSTPDLDINLDSATPGSPLAPVVGQEAGGEWRLQVVDAVGIDQGSLTGWGLTVQTD
ncbi:proprotein convertase P-domain-containing protein [Actinomycetospora straminea]|uniref:P/Homo B domain-containing protein n=1 Tax=Actinomycetospora straminea TaxID=663607 RepID=A0ABP9DVB1_9PSEU|nr:proprotein convertase P-domain-containing protein [Actinomycetospora straminea]MDD7932334.1 proprotein convertase P-domain-containing protein [Actinomycetospora straminea]